MFSSIYVGRFDQFLYRKKETVKVSNYIGEVRLPYVRMRFGAFVLTR